MAKKLDRSIIDALHQYIAAGMTEAMMVRRLVGDGKCNRDTARRYIDRVFKELSVGQSTDKRVRAFIKVEAMIATDRMTAIKQGNLREQGKASERYMTLHGLNKQTIDVTPQTAAAMAASGTTDLTSDKATSGQLRAILQGLIAGDE